MKKYTVELYAPASVRFWDQVEADDVNEAKIEFKKKLDEIGIAAPIFCPGVEIIHGPKLNHDYNLDDIQVDMVWDADWSK